MTAFDIKEVLLDFREETRGVLRELRNEVRELRNEFDTLKLDFAASKATQTTRWDVAQWTVALLASSVVSALVVWFTKG